MIEFDPQSTKSPSLMTGTRPFGFNDRNSEVSVCLNPVPQSSRSKGMCSSAHAHSTLRTLMDDAFPRIFSMRGSYGWQCTHCGQTNFLTRYLHGARKPASNLRQPGLVCLRVPRRLMR